MPNPHHYSVILYNQGTFSLMDLVDDEYEQQPNVFDFADSRISTLLLENPPKFLDAMRTFCASPEVDQQIVGGYTASGTACFMFEDESVEDAFYKFLTSK